MKYSKDKGGVSIEGVNMYKLKTKYFTVKSWLYNSNTGTLSVVLFSEN